MDTSNPPTYIDGTPLTSLVTFMNKGVKYRYRQSLPETHVIPQDDLILHVASATVYTVAVVAYNLETGTVSLVVVVESDGVTLKYLNLNEVRILHDETTFDPKLN